jgi:hypothetical protein
MQPGFFIGVLNSPVKRSTAIKVAVLYFLNGFALAESFFFGPLGFLGPGTPGYAPGVHECHYYF